MSDCSFLLPLVYNRVMESLSFFFAFIFGLIIGSFLNVVALRFGIRKVSRGRSMCFACGKTLTALELIPLFSFLFLKGKCYKCKTPISWRYPLVELGTGLVFGLTALVAENISYFLFFGTVFSVLIVVALYDAKHKIIPDSLSFIFGCLGFVYYLVTFAGQYASTESLIHLTAGPFLFLPFFLVWFFSGGAWMGLGDAKLAVGIGWLLGLAGGLSAVIIGIWAGAIWSVTLMLLQKARSRKQLTMKSEIPLAPFLILGTFISFVIQPDIFNIDLWIQLFLN